MGINSEIKLSVIVPTHGRVGLFKETLESLLSQTSKEFEVIVTDDSSSAAERTEIKDLVDDAKKKNLEIVYIFTEKNLRQAKNTNQGLKLAKGRYLRILHSDDLLSPVCIETEIDLFESNPNIDILFHAAMDFSEKQFLAFSCTTYCDYRMYDTWSLLSAFIFTNTIQPSCLCFRRSLYERCGGMDETYDFLCDWELFYRFLMDSAKNKKSLISVPSGYVAWRIHYESTSGKMFVTHFLEHERFCVKLKNDYLEKKFFDDEVYLKRNLLNALIYRNKRLLVDYFKQPFSIKMSNLLKIIILIFSRPSCMVLFLLNVIFRPYLIIKEIFNILITMKNRLCERLSMLLV